MRRDTQTAINNIMDVFTGADGGVGFVKFRAMIEQMDRESEDGSKDAATILDVMFKFSRLLDAAKRSKPL